MSTLSKVLTRAFAVPALFALLTVAACSTPNRPFAGGRAVVVHAPERAGDAVETAKRLRDAGFQVMVTQEGPAVRTRSSATVYDVGRRPELMDVVPPLLDPLPDVAVEPSPHPGPGTTDLVVWLVAQ